MGRGGRGLNARNLKALSQDGRLEEAQGAKKSHRSHSIFRQGHTTVWTAHAVNSTFLQQDMEGWRITYTY